MQILTCADSAYINTLYTLLNTKTEISDHENIGIDTLLIVIACTDIDNYRFFSNGSTNQEISDTKPHPRSVSNIFLR